MWVITLVITAVVSLNYAFLILFFRRGWKKLPSNVKPSKGNTFISVLIPVRNEQENIPVLIKQLKKQSYQNGLWEVLFINDHSTDNSVILISQNSNQLKNVKLIHLQADKSGKKHAIWWGIQNSSGKLIVTLDADCLPAEKWLETIAYFYQASKPQLIIAPVIMNRRKSMSNALFGLEFISLLASTAGAAGKKKPIMCNGANLAFERALIKKISDIYEHPSASGDDIFLLEEVKRKGKKISFCKSVNACVYTDPPQNIRQFINQRLRWAAKSSQYQDHFLIYTAISVFLINFALVGTLISSIFNFQIIYVFVSLLLLKGTVDSMLLKPVSIFFNLKALLKPKYYLSTQLLYPFYSVFIAFASQVSGFNWKNRRYKN